MRVISISLMLRVTAAGLSGVLLSGCFGGNPLNCEDPGLYGYSDSMPPMRVPDGMDVPDESDSLQIPPGEELVVQDPETMSECLEAPPNFFDE